MRQFTVADLRQFADDADAFSESVVGTKGDALFRAFSAAVIVLAETLGPAWVEREVFGGHPPTSQFLQSGAGGDGFRHQDRVIVLAEMIFNLQHVDGIDDRVARLATENIESVVSELEGARLLHGSGYAVRFIVPSGKRGADCEFEVTLGDTAVACEVKTKLETTPFSPEGVYNAINDARDQLPADRPTIVFLKFPSRWAENAENETLFLDAVQRAFASTRRISTIIVQYERWYVESLDGTGPAARATFVRAFHNPRARHSLSRFGKIIAMRSSHWTSFTSATRPDTTTEVPILPDLGGEGGPNTGYFTNSCGVASLPEPVGHTFPLWTHDADGTWELVGTGFYVSPDGLFVTARHVVDHVLDEHGAQVAPLVIMQLISDSGLFGPDRFVLRPIGQCWRSSTSDVAFGFATRATNKETGVELQH